MSLRRKENSACATDNKETRVGTDVDELADEELEVEKWEDMSA